VDTDISVMLMGRWRRVEKVLSQDNPPPWKCCRMIMIVNEQFSLSLYKKLQI